MATSTAAIFRLRFHEYDVPANPEQNTRNTMPAIMFTKCDSAAKPHRLPRMMAMLRTWKSMGTGATRRARTTVMTPITNSMQLTMNGNMPGPARPSVPSE